MWLLVKRWVLKKQKKSHRIADDDFWNAKSLPFDLFPYLFADALYEALSGS